MHKLGIFTFSFLVIATLSAPFIPAVSVYFRTHQIVIINPDKEIVVNQPDFRQGKNSVIHSLVEKVYDHKTEHLKETLQMQSDLIAKLQNECKK